MTKKQTKRTVILSDKHKFMNQKINWMRRSRLNTAARDIPIRFGRGAAGFEVKIKSSARNRILDVETLRIQVFGSNGLVGSIEVVPPLPVFRRELVMAPATLPVRILNERRLEAVLKTSRKKRC
jgi:hypothetical protein